MTMAKHVLQMSKLVFKFHIMLRPCGLVSVIKHNMDQNQPTHKVGVATRRGHKLNRKKFLRSSHVDTGPD